MLSSLASLSVDALRVFNLPLPSTFDYKVVGALQARRCSAPTPALSPRWLCQTAMQLSSIAPTLSEVSLFRINCYEEMQDTWRSVANKTKHII